MDLFWWKAGGVHAYVLDGHVEKSAMVGLKRYILVYIETCVLKLSHRSTKSGLVSQVVF